LTRKWAKEFYAMQSNAAAAETAAVDNVKPLPKKVDKEG